MSFACLFFFAIQALFKLNWAFCGPTPATMPRQHRALWLHATRRMCPSKFLLVREEGSSEVCDVFFSCLCLVFINPRSLEEIKLHNTWVGGVSIGPPPSTFDTIHPIGMIFGTYNNLPLYLQLSQSTRCLIGFHGNQSYINDVTSGRHLGFSNFQILFKYELWYFKMTKFSNWNLQNSSNPLQSFLYLVTF